jgi:transposase
MRFNADGLAGLNNRPTSDRPPALTEAELALLSARIFRSPARVTDGVSSRTLPDFCRWIEDRFEKRLPPQSLSRILQREGFSRQKTRPTHPKADDLAQRHFERRCPHSVLALPLSPEDQYTYTRNISV